MVSPNTSEAAKAGLNQTVAPVEDFVLAGVQQRILTVFDAKALWTTSEDKIKAKEQLFKGEGRKYPHAYLILTSMQRASDRMNTRWTSLRGAPVTVTTDQKHSFRASFLPTDFQVSLEYVTNSAEQMRQFANSWLFAAQQGLMKFSIEYGRIKFDVGAELTDSVQFPLRNASPDEAQEYLVSTEMKILGYISTPVLQRHDTIDTVVIEGQVGAGAKDDGTVAWTFKRSGWTHESPSGSDGPPKGIS